MPSMSSTIRDLRCTVIIRTKKFTDRTGKVREMLEKCNKPARIFIVTKRNGLAPAKAEMCLQHAKRLGNKWLVWTAEYWNTKNQK